MKQDGPLVIIWRQIKNPLALVLSGSGILAFLLGKPTDGAVVIAVVVVNAIIGAVQEYRAVRAMAALDALVPEKSLVQRDGRPAQVPASDLVAGDVVVLESGDRVPADLRLVHARNLQVNEAALTGEALPASKQAACVPARAGLAERTNMLYSGTFVTSGTARAVVVGTGVDTELGRISTLMQQSKDTDTPLTKKFKWLGAFLTKIISVFSLGIFFIAHQRGFPLLTSVRSAVAFACAAIPVGLPAVITITLAISVKRMAARNAVVRTLPSVETLGSTTVICSDKTGTLTQGEMTVRFMWAGRDVYELTGTGYLPKGELKHQGNVISEAPPEIKGLVTCGEICNDAMPATGRGSEPALGDPTEIALLVAAEKLGFSVGQARSDEPRIDSIPFESANRYMATLHGPAEGGQKVIIKGAPEVVFKLCGMGESNQLELGHYADPAAAGQIVDLFAAHGMRVLAIATSELAEPQTHLAPENLGSAKLVGLFGMVDPARPEATLAINVCQSAGIHVKMATGDHPETARAIGGELGLTAEGDRVVTGAEIAGLTRYELEALAPECGVFARVEPEHKLRLVEALQAQGEIVAMTGDGVNDAPALKTADIGVAMGKGGTATARDASNIVLVDDNFASIAAAIEEGRRCYDNLMKALMFLLPSSLGQALIVLIGVIYFPVVEGVPLTPIIPVQVLWVNLATGVTLALPLAFERAEPDVMQRTPHPKDEPLLSWNLAVRSALVGVLAAAAAITLFLVEFYTAQAAGVETVQALTRARTMVATVMVLFQLFYLFQCRSLHRSMFSVGLMSNPTIWVGVGATIVMQLAFVHWNIMNQLFHSASLSLTDWALSALVASLVVPVVSLHKNRMHASHRRRNGTDHPNDHHQ